MINYPPHPAYLVPAKKTMSDVKLAVIISSVVVIASLAVICGFSAWAVTGMNRTQECRELAQRSHADWYVSAGGDCMHQEFWTGKWYRVDL